MLSPDVTSSTKHLFGHVAIALRHGNASLRLRPCPAPPELDGLCFTAVVFLLFYFIFLLIFVHLLVPCLFVFWFHIIRIQSKTNKKTTAYLICKIIFFFFWFLFTCFFVCPSFGFIFSQSSEFNQKQKIKKNPAYLICFCFLFVPYLFLFWCYLIRIQSKTKN